MWNVRNRFNLQPPALYPLVPFGCSPETSVQPRYPVPRMARPLVPPFSQTHLPYPQIYGRYESFQSSASVFPNDHFPTGVAMPAHQQGQQQFHHFQEPESTNMDRVGGASVEPRRPIAGAEQASTSRQKNPETVVCDLLQKQVNAAYDALFALTHPKQKKSENSGIIIPHTSSSTEAGSSKDFKPVGDFEASSSGEAGSFKDFKPVEKISKAAEVAPWTKRSGPALRRTSTKGKNTEIPSDVIDLCGDDEFESAAATKCVKKIHEEDSVIHLCCSETHATVEKVNKAPVAKTVENRDAEYELDHIEYDQVPSHLIPYDAEKSEQRREQLPPPTYLGVWERWQPERSERSYLQRFGSGGMRSPFTSYEKYRYEGERRKRDRSPPYASMGRSWYERDERRRKCRYQGEERRRRCRYEREERRCKSRWDSPSNRSEQSDRGKAEENKSTEREPRSECGGRHSSDKERPENILVELRSDEGRSISLDRKTEELEIFAVDDDGGEI